jgi:hypothetical protein
MADPQDPQAPPNPQDAWLQHPAIGVPAAALSPPQDPSQDQGSDPNQSGGGTDPAPSPAPPADPQQSTPTMPSIVAIAVRPVNPTIAAGAQQQFSATGTFSDTTSQDVTTTVKWSSSAPDVITVDSGGLATAQAVGGTATVAATDPNGGMLGVANVTVQPPPPVLQSIAIAPANPSLMAGAQQQFTATGTFSDGSSQDMSSAVAWSSSAADVMTVDNQGHATAHSSAGTATISATDGSSGVTGSTTATVTAPVLQSIAVTPANPSVAAGAQQQFTATGTFSDGSSKDVTGAVSWSSSATDALAVDGNGLATAQSSAGAASVTATDGSTNVSGSTNVTVTAPTPVLQSIAVAPANPSLAAGGQQQFSATGTFSDGTTQEVTNTVAWSSSSTDVITINGNGLATAQASAGTASLIATDANTNVSGSTSVTVTAAAPVLQSIAVTPANASIAAGAQQQMTATGTLSDGTTQDITGSANWSSSAADTVAVDSKGVASAQAGSGTATITATDANSNVSGSANITVTAPTKTWEELEPLCNQYFSDHHFKAVKGEEIVPGDMSCDMYLDDHLVEVRAMTQSGQAQISAALVAAFPDLQSYPVQLAHLIAERWDFEMQPIRQILQSIKDKPKLPPDGVLHRRSDGALFWEPNSAQITWGDTKPTAPDSWVTDYLNFFSFGPADDADASPAPACKFDSEPTTIDAVVATMGEQAALADYTLDSGAAKAAAKKLYDAALAARQKPPDPSSGAPASASHIEITYSVLYVVVARTDHSSLDPDPAHNKPAGDPSHDKPGQQLQYNINVQVKAVTLSFSVQFTLFRDSDGSQRYAVQNVQMGPQVAIDVTPAFLKGIVEFDPIAQALVGESRQEVRGSMQLVPTYQLAAGLQITKKFQLPGSKIKFVLSAQATGSLTDPRGVPRTLDVSENFGLGIEW